MREVPSVLRLLRRTILFWVGLGFLVGAAIMLTVAMILAQVSPSETPFGDMAWTPDRGGPGAAASEGDIAVMVVGALGLLEGVAGGFMLWRARLGARRLNRIGREGVAIAGRLLEVMPTGVRINGVAQYRLRYDYMDEGGTLREGRSWLWPWTRLGKYEPGTAIDILIDPRDTRQSAWAGDLDLD